MTGTPPVEPVAPTRPATVATVADMISSVDAQREATEEKRSVLRNRNRLLVLVTGMIISVLWPIMTTHGHPTAAELTTAAALAGDMIVTAYAWRKRY